MGIRGLHKEPPSQPRQAANIYQVPTVYNSPACEEITVGERYRHTNSSPRSILVVNFMLPLSGCGDFSRVLTLSISLSRTWVVVRIN